VTYFSRAGSQADNLLRTRRAIVAVYEEDEEATVYQCGTGFIVDDGDSAFLLTAQHTLYGTDGRADPYRKALYWEGSLKTFNQIGNGTIGRANGRDLVAVPIERSSNVVAFGLGDFEIELATATILSISGFLVRDFKRSAAAKRLRPQPYVYSNLRVDKGPDVAAMAYSYSRNTAPGARSKVRAPIPRGLSGCPMMDATQLAEGKARIVGVFTDQVGGEAFGPSARHALGLLDALRREGHATP
jgi:hypothetical protein